ncbi:mitochondrial tRNA-specific 2-thiouridylase 1 isoform X1 [Leptinotarsa decemlineata]|uniref:mitochondrial tRNA-specific 2-thiouridylase 1 isoform X1 n=2 Tax=Leptinotarsa decemlineata TaxID=7539 RepID=UPI003D30873A
MFRKVAVGISGGVDSAVAALLLKQKCFEVQGVFMQNWDIRDEKGVCSSEEDYKDAKFVCETLNIKLHHVNFTKEYWNDVFCPLIKDYQSGLTPNPDVLCNRKIKFNYFYKFAREVLKVDAIATGHYAKTNFDPFMENFDPDGSARLLLAKDTKKDQTFFLCQIQQEALKRTIFPLGDIMKSEVKNIARNNGLEKISLKPESMGICFIGSRKFQDFIQEYIPDRPGVFVDIDTGRVVGEHNGIHQWTLGQRARLPGLAMAYFIAQKDAEKNIIYVAQGTDHPILYTDLFFTGQPHWIHSRPQELVQGNILECLFKFQHTQEWIPCEICETPLGITIRLSREKRAITGGQYAVFAKNGECLGSAKIRNSGVSKFSCNYSTNLKNTVTI